MKCPECKMETEICKEYGIEKEIAHDLSKENSD